ncbi:MAG: DUF4105 domain-containing protein [Planctomycetia bacterium]|jgi:hypothetical protein
MKMVLRTYCLSILGLALLASLGCIAKRPSMMGPSIAVQDAAFMNPPVSPAEATTPVGEFLDPVIPSNHRDWIPEQSVMPVAEFQPDNKITVRNVRYCEYRTAEDYTVRHYDKVIDLDKVRTVDFIVVPFPEMPDMAHTMISFGIGDDDYLGVSVEARREKGETYNPLAGLMGQFELMYVIGDERDLIQLRTNHWRNDVYVHRLHVRPEQARAMLVDVLHRTNQLALVPELYNTLSNNCTTNLIDHMNEALPVEIEYDRRILLSGRADRMIYDLGLIDTSLPFSAARTRARVNYYAYLYRDNPHFSRLIREQNPAVQPVRR